MTENRFAPTAGLPSHLSCLPAKSLRYIELMRPRIALRCEIRSRSIGASIRPPVAVRLRDRRLVAATAEMRPRSAVFSAKQGKGRL